MAKKRAFTLERKKAVLGVLFVAPWLIGFVLLMAIPLYQSIRFSLSELMIHENGYALEFIGLENYKRAFFVDPWFNRILTTAVMNMVLNVPLIIFFSLFTATLLSQKFRGRAFARTIIFLPVILSSGVIASLDSGNFLIGMMESSAADMEGNYSGLKSIELTPILLEAGMPMSVVRYLTDAVERIYQIVSSSGVQILIFLAGLQSISPFLYESAKMEGATGYEMFWKITFPLMTPLILTNTVYSIVDSFYNNKVTGHIHAVAFQQLNFGLSSAMSWIYFVLIAIILLVSTYVISKRVHYYD